MKTTRRSKSAWSLRSLGVWPSGLGAVGLWSVAGVEGGVVGGEVALGLLQPRTDSKEVVAVAVR